MDCLYLKNKNKCLALKEKQCNKCSFYKKNTKENLNKFILNVEKDILVYAKKIQSGA